MARHHVALAFAAAMSSLLLFLQLQHHFGGGILDKNRWTKESSFFWDWLTPGAQSPLQPEDTFHTTANTGAADDGEYLIGVGKADITGPVVEINFMGYADPSQTGTGLRQRLYARSFIVASRQHPEDRFVYVVLDTQSGDTAVRYGILEGLKAKGSDYSLYGQENVAITGTHSHSGPGAWLNYLLPQITSKGFHRQSYEAIVNGTLLSIQRAHQSLAPGSLRLSKATILDANINRSPYAYLANPLKERQQYEHDVDKELTLLAFTRADDGKDVGVLTWFPVHGTSMLGNNTLVTGDNKGVAARLFEQDMSGDFVAGFSQANVGDTSPNVNGAYCEDGSGEQCTFETSLCGGKTQTCHGRGPHFGLDDAGTRSCFEIGRRQYHGAKDAYESAEKATIAGPVRSVHVFRDFSDFAFPHPNGSVVTTCSAAMGYSFAAGTTDGPGAFDFKQNNSDNANSNPLWKVVRNALHTPSEDQIACQAPKPILLDVGATHTPYHWTPNIVDVQLFRVGQLVIVVSPGEATTMAGRRWKAAVKSGLEDMTGEHGIEVVLGGPANSYSHYIATEEEYFIQRYEGASTLYGPHTLNGYIYESRRLLQHLATDRPKSRPLPGPSPPIQISQSLSFINPVVRDGSGFFSSFGDLLEDVLAPGGHRYKAGETVKARFVGANPRNNLRLEGTFVAVRQLATGSSPLNTSLSGLQGQAAAIVRTDADWDLVYEWKRTSSITGTSEVTVSWELGDDIEAGTYQLVYYGDSKSLGGTITPFVGESGPFAIG